MKGLLILSLLQVIQSSVFISWRVPSDSEVVANNKNNVTINEPSLERRAVEDDHIQSYDEFLDSFQKELEKGSLKGLLKKGSCDSKLTPTKEGGNLCYAVSAGDLTKVISDHKSINKDLFSQFYNKDISIHSVLALATRSETKALGRINSEKIDFFHIVFDRDPQCDIGYSTLQTMGGTIVGAGNLLQTQTKFLTDIEGSANKISLSLSPKFFNSVVNIGMTKDDRKSIRNTETNISVFDYKSFDGKTCTPSLIKAGAFCKKATARFVLGSNGKLIADEVVELPESLLNIEGTNGRFRVKRGCIDYTI